MVRPEQTFYDKSKRLRAADVKYLCFEGGGGKGNVFPGAVRALQNPALLPSVRLGILQHQSLTVQNIRGMAGASAGAINALFLSCGWDADEIDIIMSLDETDFNSFFDLPAPLVPRVGGGRVPDRPAALSPSQQSFYNAVAGLLYVLPEIHRRSKRVLYEQPGLEQMTAAYSALWQDAVDIKRYINSILQPSSGPLPMDPALARYLEDLIAFLALHGPEEAIRNATADPAQTALSIWYDWGVFPGCLIREFFEKWVTIARFRVTSTKRFEEANLSYEAYRTRLGELAYPLPESATEDAVQTTAGLIAKEYLGRDIDFKATRSDGSFRYPKELAKEWIIQTMGRVALINELVGLYNYADAGMMSKKGTRFVDHAEIFKIKLVVSGTNLTTAKSELMSAETTPRLPVADAVRISMSLPVGFKPFIISGNEDLSQVIGPSDRYDIWDERLGARRRHFMEGVWLDGGFLDNCPLYAFEAEEGGTGKTKTLGFRLQLEEPATIATLADFTAKGWPGGFLFGTGESHISESRHNYVQTIMLNTGELGTVDFKPAPEVLQPLQEEAYAYTLAYFGLEPDV